MVNTIEYYNSCKYDILIVKFWNLIISSASMKYTSGNIIK